MMVRRVYFGNWLRDYSQAMDVGSLKGVQAGTIRILVWILSFLSFGYATAEFEVTEERLGVYRPEEHSKYSHIRTVCSISSAWQTSEQSLERHFISVLLPIKTAVTAANKGTDSIVSKSTILKTTPTTWMLANMIQDYDPQLSQ